MEGTLNSGALGMISGIMGFKGAVGPCVGATGVGCTRGTSSFSSAGSIGAGNIGAGLVGMVDVGGSIGVSGTSGLRGDSGNLAVCGPWEMSFSIVKGMMGLMGVLCVIVSGMVGREFSVLRNCGE